MTEVTYAPRLRIGTAISLFHAVIDLEKKVTRAIVGGLGEGDAEKLQELIEAATAFASDST